jgi:signal transduction histidine kinase
VQTDIEQRILLRAATSRDAIMARDVLGRAGIHAQVCATMAELLAELSQGVGAVMMAEELMAGDGLRSLTHVLAAQPPWSDLPLLVLARQGADSRAIARVMDEFANVTVIERPMRVTALVSAVRSALRARRRQYELRSVLDGLREADQRKTEFLATLAHELRNPLAPLTNALALLSRKPLAPADAQRVHELMRRQIDHMVRLVDDLMEVSRITRGKVELQREALPLQTVIADAMELSRPLLEASGQTVSVEWDDALEDRRLCVSGDAVRLTQVFANLLNNAAKYTPGRGRIEVRLGRESEMAVVEVKDSGVGLAPHMLESVFDMFVQVAGTARVAQGGLGIGLTLVRSLVEMHGGSVVATSPGLGLGASFTVRLPVAAQPCDPAGRKRQAEAPAEVPGERTVLVVDDNRDAADSLAELLRVMGATALAAYSGDEALQVAARYHVDIAVLDIGMPVMDGCDLARQLRARHGEDTPRLIALTGWGQPADRDRIARAGFDHHLLKPVDAAALMALL